MKKILLGFFILVFVIVWAISGLLSTAQADSEARALSASVATINGNPLKIHVGSDGSTQVEYVPLGSPSGQFYPTNQTLADMGIFVWHEIHAYGPNFSGHPSTRYTNPPSPFIEKGQSGVTGSGTSADPYHVTTTLGIPQSGMTIVHVHTYVNGQQHYTMTSTFSHTSTSPVNVTYFHAGDIFHTPGDVGVGVYDAATHSVGGKTPTDSFFTLFGHYGPPASHYEENVYSTIWDHIGRGGSTGTGLTDSINPSVVDHGAGLEWDNVGIPVGGTTTISHWLSFGPTAVIPTAPQQPPPPPAQVPEGDSLMLVGTGLAGLAGYASLRWRARRARK